MTSSCQSAWVLIYVEIIVVILRYYCLIGSLITRRISFLPVDSFGVWMPALMEDLLILVHRLTCHLNAQLLHEPSVDR